MTPRTRPSTAILEYIRFHEARSEKLGARAILICDTFTCTVPGYAEACLGNGFFTGNPASEEAAGSQLSADNHALSRLEGSSWLGGRAH